MSFDWQQFHASNADAPTVVDPRRRLGICLAGFVVLLLVVLGRVVQLEVMQGAGFRAEALRPIEKQTVLPAARGRILARDGTVLAFDRPTGAVAVQYRWLQDPPDDRWLRAAVRGRLSKADRKSPAKLAAAKAQVFAERAEAADRLARLCGLSTEQWAARAKRIQLRVERIAESHNRRPRDEAEATEADASWSSRLRRLLLDEPAPPREEIKEQRDYHVMADDVPVEAVAEIENQPERYPGAKIVNLLRRTYPEGTLAAHVLGHLGLAEQNSYVGRMGVERQYDALLQAHPGLAIEQTDRGGHMVASYCRQQLVAGRDVELTLDVRLQRTAEELLQSALQRRAIAQHAAQPDKRGQNYFSETNSSDPFFSGGAIVVMDIGTGAILAAASAPNFDPNLFVQDDSDQAAALLADRSTPLFDRVARMAIPPGSTFKTLTAVALLESGAVSPQDRFTCQGYLNHPDRQRCEIYVRQGIGHGEVTLADALAVSCNVYFWHFAGLMGPRPLIDWAERFGFGRPTGVDLPSEAAGTLPTPENIEKLEGHAWRTVDTQSLAVGQGSLAATPLQVLCMMAAVANGGRLVTPHLAKRGQGSGIEGQGSEVRGQSQAETRDGCLNPERRTLNPISFLSPTTLPAIREGLLRVVADRKGTAHATVYIESTAIAGKTGTAETGGDQASHAWFAGYVPAQQPKLAFVVVLEHAGEAATSAGPVAKRLVVRMEQLGLL